MSAKLDHIVEANKMVASPAAMSADTAPAAMPGDLADRCRELLAWGKTGLLQGEAIRAYAEEQFSHFEREADRIAQAERATNKQAMEAVLGFAPILAEKEAEAEQWQNLFESTSASMQQEINRAESRALAAEAALKLVAEQDVTEIALDPDWPRRICAAAIRAGE